MFCVFTIVGCGAQPSNIEITPVTTDLITSPSDNNIIMVYYTKASFLTPVSIVVKNAETQVDNAVNILFSGISPEGFENNLTNVTLNSYNICGDTVNIDVSEEFLKGDITARRIDQIVYTLTDCDNIFHVNITVNGDSLGTSFERPLFINLQNSEELEKDKDNPDELRKYLVIFYTDKDKDYLIPVTIKSDKVKVGSQKESKVEDVANAALQHLIETPDNINVLATFPKGIEIKSLQIADGIATVDLDTKSLLNFIHEAKYAEIAIESVVRTLTAIDDIEKVQFLFNGTKYGYVTSNVSVENPIKPDKWYNILTD